MAWRNSADGFGLITRLLHWGMALLILAQLALGLRLVTMQPGLANLWLYGLHKTLGFLVLALLVLRVLWHGLSPVPGPLGPAGVAATAARLVHRLIYALLVAIPLSGWAGSSATGIDVMIADRWVVPPLVEPSEVSEAFWFGWHWYLALVLAGLVALHVAGALKRALSGDGTLRRMIRGRV